MTLPKGFDDEDQRMADLKAAEEKKIVDALTEKEILLKILEKLTSIDQSLEQMFEMQTDDWARRKVDRSNSESYLSGL